MQKAYATACMAVPIIAMQNQVVTKLGTSASQRNTGRIIGRMSVDRRFSHFDLQERVLDDDPFDNLAVAQVLGEDSVGPSIRGRGNNESVPEGDLVPFCDLGRQENRRGIVRRDLPGEIVPDEAA